MNRYLVLAALLLVGVATVVGCNPAANNSSVSSPVDYGNGVYYFPVVDRHFGNALSAFIGARPELELVALTGNDAGLYGSNVGHFAVFRQKAK